MFGLILACTILLGYVIDLNLWQGVVVVLFNTGIYLTGRWIERDGDSLRKYNRKEYAIFSISLLMVALLLITLRLVAGPSIPGGM